MIVMKSIKNSGTIGSNVHNFAISLDISAGKGPVVAWVNKSFIVRCEDGVQCWGVLGMGGRQITLGDGSKKLTVEQNLYQSKTWLIRILGFV